MLRYVRWGWVLYSLLVQVVLFLNLPFELWGDPVVLSSLRAFLVSFDCPLDGGLDSVENV